MKGDGEGRKEEEVSVFWVGICLSPASSGFFLEEGGGKKKTQEKGEN